VLGLRVIGAADSQGCSLPVQGCAQPACMAGDGGASGLAGGFLSRPQSTLFDPIFADPERLALSSLLAGYRGLTRGGSPRRIGAPIDELAGPRPLDHIRPRLSRTTKPHMPPRRFRLGDPGQTSLRAAVATQGHDFLGAPAVFGPSPYAGCSTPPGGVLWCIRKRR
jgi:hypothetical protein